MNYLALDANAEKHNRIKLNKYLWYLACYVTHAHTQNKSSRNTHCLHCVAAVCVPDIRSTWLFYASHFYYPIWTMYFIESAPLQPATMDKLLPDFDDSVFLPLQLSLRLGNWTQKSFCQKMWIFVRFEMSSSNMFLVSKQNATQSWRTPCGVVEPMDDKFLVLLANNFWTETKQKND